MLQIVESGDVRDNGWLELDGLKEVGVVQNPRTERHLLRPFDVLVTARAEPVQAVLVPPSVSRTVAGTTLLVVRPKYPESGMGHWLWYFLTSRFGQEQLSARLTVTTTTKALSARALGEIDVPMPSPSDLDRIARLVEVSEEAYTSAIAASKLRRDTVRDSVILEMISGTNAEAIGSG